MSRQQTNVRMLSACWLLIVCLWFCLFQVGQLQAAPLKPLADRIADVLNAPDLDHGFWGIEVVSATTGETLYAQNANKLFTPASNTKLFTTAAALSLIGPDYKFRTTVETAGSVDHKGKLKGDLVLVGRGDPNLSGRVLPYNQKTQRDDDPVKALETLAEAVAQKGIREIHGDIVADDSYFAYERYGVGWGWDDLVWGDGAPVSALAINDNIVFVDILPGTRPGDKALISAKPLADYYRIDNRIVTTPSNVPRKFSVNREPGSKTLELWGSIPVGDPGSNEGIAVDDPAEFAAGIFRQLLEKRGIVIHGWERTRHMDLAVVANNIPEKSGQTTVLVSCESQPLLQDIRVINKVSQNLHAEIMLRLLGRERGTAGTAESGLEVLAGFLTQAGIASDQYAFHDGSGLSRQNLVTPHAVVQLLRYVAQQPWGSAFKSTLPVSGVDGSLTDRLTGPRLQNRIMAKTGSLTGVRALSGYATTESGQAVIFSILANNLNVSGKRATEAIDAIVQAIVEDTPNEKP